MWQAFLKQMGSRTAQAPEDALQGLQTEATQFTNTTNRSWLILLFAAAIWKIRSGPPWLCCWVGLKLGRSGTSNVAGQQWGKAGGKGCWCLGVCGVGGESFVCYQTWSGLRTWPLEGRRVGTLVTLSQHPTANVPATRGHSYLMLLHTNCCTAENAEKCQNIPLKGNLFG